jgi:5'-3' exonuclease
MICNLIIDGNYILNKNTFALHKNNLLFGGLHKSLEISISNYRKWYPFANVYLVSDSKEKSWRKKLSTNYKSTRKKDFDIDWEFVFGAYNEFKKLISEKGVKILEASSVEGDDWISFLTHKANSEGRSTIIVSNDYDIKQLVRYSLNPLYINIMTNEMMNRQKLFLPRNYQLFVDTLSRIDNDDIFNLNDNSEFLSLFNNFLNKYEISETDPVESLLVKVISGDSSDNISSVWSIVKSGKKRGIGDKGAKSVFRDYLVEFGEPNLDDPDLAENIADLICERKKLSKTSIISIKENIYKNMQLINLSMENLPVDIIQKMNIIYESL